MSGQRKMPGVFEKNEKNNTLNHMLDFGPQKNNPPSPQSLPGFNSDSNLERIKQIVKALSEISKRIDNLSDRL